MKSRLVRRKHYLTNQSIYLKRSATATVAFRRFINEETFEIETEAQRRNIV